MAFFTRKDQQSRWKKGILANFLIMPLYDKYPIHLTNSLSGKKELFTPINPGHIGMYVCGPTVYNKAHLGNVRTFSLSIP